MEIILAVLAYLAASFLVLPKDKRSGRGHAPIRSGAAEFSSS